VTASHRVFPRQASAEGPLASARGDKNRKLGGNKNSRLRARKKGSGWQKRLRVTKRRMTYG